MRKQSGEATFQTRSIHERMGLKKSRLTRSIKIHVEFGIHKTATRGGEKRESSKLRRYHTTYVVR